MTLEGLVKRGGVWTYRRRVPEKLRVALGCREVWRSLDTPDESVAINRWRKVKLDVDRAFNEARAGITSPAVAAYKAVEGWREADPETESVIDTALTSLLDADWLDRLPSKEQADAIKALLGRRESGGADNPPLSVVFTRYYAERKLPAKTKLEWDGVLRRIQAVMGGDAAVRSVTQAHVRMLKDTMLAQPARRGGSTLSPATVQKNLSGLRAVLSWAKRNGYITSNPAEEMIVVTKDNDDSGRLPYSPEDLKALFAVKRERGANYWLPYLALYTGARLEELGQLSISDVVLDEPVVYFRIAPGDGKRVKTKSSKRNVPIHPALMQLGLMQYVHEQRRLGYEGKDALFPELTRTSYGSLTAAWSKYWGRHARAIISDRRKTFHSFRHGWKDAARAVMPEEHHDAITGHSNGSVGRSYGQGVPLKVLAESMAKINFPV